MVISYVLANVKMQAIGYILPNTHPPQYHNVICEQPLMGSNPLPDTFFSIKSKDFYKEKFIEMINLKPKEQIKPRKFKKRIFLIGHSYTTVRTFADFRQSP